jgi:hypothetical protein
MYKGFREIRHSGLHARFSSLLCGLREGGINRYVRFRIAHSGSRLCFAKSRLQSGLRTEARAAPWAGRLRALISHLRASSVGEVMDEWYDRIAAECVLPPQAAQQTLRYWLYRNPES